MKLYRWLRWPVDECGDNDWVERRKLKEWYMDGGRPWYEVYNFVEFVVQTLLAEDNSEHGMIVDALNEALEQEGAGYRFVEQRLVAITNKVELGEVAEAAGHKDKFAAVSAHIQAAMDDLGKRPQGDFRDCIKESIHAVGSALKIATGGDANTLEAALREFEKTRPLHPALRVGLSKLYGYTNDEKGLRHELLEPNANVGFAEAKFFLVACSAFANYVIERAGANKKPAG